jgi:16S rRNA (guanine527-N7)-methyltransferase
VSAEQIQAAFAESGIPELPSHAYVQLDAYLELLLRWNARLSLTSIRDPEQIIQRHLLECAFAAMRLPGDTETLLDYGSGAGLPGIVISLCRPDIKVTLAEAHGKKAAFLREAVRSLGLGTEVFDKRVEDLPASRIFGAVSLRAVEKMELAILVALRHVGKYLVLFTTEQSLPVFVAVSPEIRWVPHIPLPNSRQMILAVGTPSVDKPQI